MSGFVSGISGFVIGRFQVALGHFTSPSDFSTSAVAWDSGFVHLLYHPDLFISCPQLSKNNFHSPSSFTNAVVK